ncbi:hypothetical protein RFI_38826, partial [Reticulomyxa filosa]
TFQFIKHDTLPTNNSICYNCFVSKSENGQVQEMMKINQKYKQNYQMLLFCNKTRLLIEYNENNNTFQFQKLPVCHDMKPLFKCAYVYINNVILFFGGWNINNVVSKSVHKYSIQEKKWMTFQKPLPSPLRDCVAILSEDNTYVHIIGGVNDGYKSMSTHMKTEVREWLSEEEMKKEEEKDSDSEMNKIVKKKDVKNVNVEIFFVLFVFD